MLCRESRLFFVKELQHQGLRWQRGQRDELESTGDGFRASETNRTDQAEKRVADQMYMTS